MAVMCASCSVPNDWHFRHCFSCGGLIKAPLRYIQQFHINITSLKFVCRPEVELASSMKVGNIYLIYYKKCV